MSSSGSDSSDSSSSESDQSHLNTKKQKIVGDDRLSALPDVLIQHILSYLPAEDSIKSSILTTRWRNLWTSVPRLTFNHSRKSSYEKFYDLINKTLIQYSRSTIQELIFSFDYVKNKQMDSNIGVWLRWASQQGASEISLILVRKYNSESYRMPQFFFNNSSLTKLVSKSCLYRPAVDVCWGSLRSISIEDVGLTSDVLQRILLGSPALESLSLSNCSNLEGIDISSSLRLEYLDLKNCQDLASLVVISSCSRLETLVLESNKNEANAEIEIDCPSLKTLKIMGCWMKRMCLLLDVSSLTNAFLDFEVSGASEACFDLVNEMLQKVDHAEQITLGPWIIQALSVPESRGLPFPWTNVNCQRLTLLTDFHKQTVVGMMSSLESLPSLQTLVLYFSKNCSRESFGPDSDGNIIEDCFQEKRDSSLSCLPGDLKTLKIVCPDLGFDQTGLFAFAQFLLRNARVLEKLVLMFGKGEPYFEVCGLQQKLLSLPRSSPHVEVLILPCSGEFSP